VRGEKSEQIDFLAICNMVLPVFQTHFSKNQCLLKKMTAKFHVKVKGVSFRVQSASGSLVEIGGRLEFWPQHLALLESFAYFKSYFQCSRGQLYILFIALG
jgi:hypothetical protein